MNKEVDCDANGVPDTPYSGLLKEVVKLLIYHWQSTSVLLAVAENEGLGFVSMKI